MAEQILHIYNVGAAVGALCCGPDVGIDVLCPSERAYARLGSHKDTADHHTLRPTPSLCHTRAS